MNGPPNDLEPRHGRRTERDPADDLRLKADRICFLIVASDYPDVDIDIEIANLRRWCARYFPNSST
jgi:hypothetical protein